MPSIPMPPDSDQGPFVYKDDDPVCIACGEEYCCRHDQEPTKWCDRCAQLLVPELLAACKAAIDAAAKEFLYQTGQTTRPQSDYPPPGRICAELGEVIPLLRSAIVKTEGQ